MTIKNWKKFRLNSELVWEDQKENIVIYFPAAGTGSVLRGLAASWFKVLAESDKINPEKAISSFLKQKTPDKIEFLNLLRSKDILVSFEKNEKEEDFSEPFQHLILAEESLASGIQHVLLKSPEQKFDCKFVTSKKKAIERLKNGKKFIFTYLDTKFSPDTHLEFNRLSLNHGHRFLSLRYVANAIEYGPMVIPGEAGCWQCYWERLTLNSGSGFSNKIPEVNNTGLEKQIIEAHITAHICSEIYRISKAIPPNSIGRVIRFDLEPCALSTHPIIALPWCLACDSAKTP